MKTTTIPTGMIAVSGNNDKYFAHVSFNNQEVNMDIKTVHPNWMTKEELNEYLTDKEIAKEERRQERLLDSYFKRMFEIESDEDYIRANWTSLMEENHYDGSEYQGVWEEKDDTCKMYKHKFGSIKAFDTEYRGQLMKGGIKFIDLLTYLCTIHEIRDLIYVTEYKIKVCKPKDKNYPEQNMLKTIAELMLEAIHLEDHHYMRNKFLLLWSAAPEDTIAGKAWNSLPRLEYSDMDQVITWQNNKAAYKTAEEIPTEDRVFWQNIYKNNYYYVLDDKAFNSVSDRSCGVEFKVV